MSLDAIYATSTFYTLQALKVLVKPEFGRKSAEKLLSDILDYESKYIEKLSIGVEFSEKIEAGWNINGHSRYGYGWYIHKNSIQKVVKKIQAEEILDISKLHVGDEVIANNEAHFLNSKIKDGFVGTIKEINYSRHIGIEFSENIGGHILNGNCKQGCGWWFERKSFNKFFKKVVKNKIAEEAA